MIRECNASDLETLEAYVKEEVYGKVILSLEKAAAMPELLDQEGQPLESDEECSGAVEKGWGILLK